MAGCAYALWGHTFRGHSDSETIVHAYEEYGKDWYRQNRAFDIAKAKRDFGCDPKVGLDVGLKKTDERYVQENLI